jgi:hypothetical protein
LPATVPVQLVWARVATVLAESNAITAVVVRKCLRIDAPRLNEFALRASPLLLEDRSQSAFGYAAPIFDSCGFSAALSSALLMTNNQLSTLVGIDAKVICNVSIGDEGRELIDTIVRGEKPAEFLVMGVNQIAAQAINICSSPTPAR